MIDKTKYRLFPDKVVYEPEQSIDLTKAIENAGAIASFENMPVELKYKDMVLKVERAKMNVQRVR